MSEVRGVPKPGHGLACVICGCTEWDACDVDGDACTWVTTDPPVCSAPECIATAGGELVLARLGAVHHAARRFAEQTTLYGAYP